MWLPPRPRAPDRSQELIFLDPDDDLATVRAKLEASPADEIFLIVPGRAATLRTPLEFRILARLAHELSTTVVIVSGDGGRRRLARQEGFRTRRGYASVRQPTDAGRPIYARFAALAVDLLPLPSVATLLVLALLALVIISIGLLALPEMRVTVTPRAQPVEREFQLTVDPDQRSPNVEKGLLPGKVLRGTFEATGSVPATGQRMVGKDPARGEAVFTNGSPNPVVLPARTVLIARNGARFLTDAEIRVNPFSYGIARIGVTAEQRGTAGNIEANQLVTTDPPIDRLTVTNPRAMVGGSDREARVVAQADLTRLKEQLVQRAREQATSALARQGGQAMSVPPNTLELRVEQESFQPAVDAEGDQLSGMLRAAATATAWDNEGLNTLVQRMVLQNFGPEYELPLSQLDLSPPEVLDTQEATMRVRVRAKALVQRGLDPVPLADQLRGKSVEEARATLEQLPGVGGVPRLEISPPWAPRAYRIEVAVATPK